MNTCQCMAGIFTPKVCGASATASCSECGKDICFAHYRLHQGTPYCAECFAGKHTDPGDDAQTDKTDWETERARIRSERESSDDSGYDDGDYMVFNSTGGSDDLSDDSIPPDSFQDS